MKSVIFVIEWGLYFQDMGIMRDYIAFAKENVQPTLSEAAQQRLIDAYVDMRYIKVLLILFKNNF